VMLGMLVQRIGVIQRPDMFIHQLIMMIIFIVPRIFAMLLQVLNITHLFAMILTYVLRIVATKNLIHVFMKKSFVMGMLV